MEIEAVWGPTLFALLALGFFGGIWLANQFDRQQQITPGVAHWVYCMLKILAALVALGSLVAAWYLGVL